jgi:hypothetical protein
MTVGLGRTRSVLCEGIITGFFCKDRRKPQMSGRVVAITVEMWAEYYLLN